jgi:hypothetical protein
MFGLITAAGRRRLLGDWAKLLARTASLEGDLNLSAWDAGSPVQPVEFTRQLGSLQLALERARQEAAASKH